MEPEVEPFTKAVIIARLDGISAMAALVGARQSLKALDALGFARDDYTSSAIFSGLVVAYARAFESARDRESGITRTFSPRGIEGFEKDLHDGLTKLRDKYVAHAGHAETDSEVLFMQGTFSLVANLPGGPQTHEVEVDFGSRAQRSFCIGPTSPEAYHRFRSHFQALEATAEDRLFDALLAHQRAWKKRIENTGNTGGRPRLMVARELSGDELSGGSLDVTHAEMMRSSPIRPTELPIEFASAYYAVNEEADGKLTFAEQTGRTIGPDHEPEWESWRRRTSRQTS